MSDENKTLLNWLNIKDGLFDKKVRWIGGPFSAFLFIVIVFLLLSGFITLLFLFGSLINFDVFGIPVTSETIRNLVLAVIALFGAPFLVWRSFIAQKQVDVAQEDLITDRINKAVEGLGLEKTVKELDNNGKSVERTVPNLEVRIGAIYALELIAKDSKRDYRRIIEIICLYIRNNAPAVSLDPTEPPFSKAVPRIDIQAAITVLGRREKKQIDIERTDKFRLDLRNTDLSGVDFSNGDFSAAMFRDCRIEGSNFNDTKLEGTQFFRSLLNFTSFYGADLKGTRFESAIITKCDISNSFVVGDVYGISVVGADLTGISSFRSTEIKNLTFGSADTKLDRRLNFDRHKFSSEQYKIDTLKEKGRMEEAEEKEKALYQNGFASWIHYTSDDLAIGHVHKKFLQKLNLIGWPYLDD